MKEKGQSLSNMFRDIRLSIKKMVDKELNELVGRKISFNGMKWSEKGEDGYHEWRDYEITVKSLKGAPGCGKEIPYELIVEDTLGNRYTIPDDANLLIIYH